MSRLKVLLTALCLVAAALLGSWLPAGAPEAWAAPAGTPTAQIEQLPVTRGINFDPYAPETHPDFASTARLGFNVSAVQGGQPIQLIGDITAANAGSTCNGPCSALAHNLVNCELLTNSAGGTDATCNVRIARFAQFGHVDGPPGFDWLVVMEEGEGVLSGTLESSLDEQGALVFPADLNLGGKMIVSVQLDGTTDILRLRSRKEPLFHGVAPAWPPHNTTLLLTNGPIPYFDEREINDPGAQPFMVVTDNVVTIESEVSNFLSIRPAITEANVVDPSASVRQVALRWSDTAGLVPDVPVTHYNVYRSIQPGDLSSWKLIATVPTAVTSYVDTVPSSAVEVAYLVTHGTDYPFGYQYEGLFGIPVRLSLGTAP